ncbi:molybdenum cofactor biosynthesis protein MoaE [Hirschia baltica]|uniref:Molybdopterin synthase catalytic subunit n=1 Tax=Hirschia baltica (strain ATCC 49814 / DSM 5838 / IFAM 1418) TaxID=582402 RepID=C6XJL4_HIRBI|nr:molybdenum cofactor biosynthesis protein MoaE [Hirschia baltica]ACT59309.1 molybdopterin biosynthesis MoaE protein [Hirschia baltica ATCC 49814]
MSNVVKLTSNSIDCQAEELELWERTQDCGAVVSFKGIARPTTKQGEPLDFLVLQAHPSMTLKSMQKITHSANERFDVKHCQVVHRHGSIAPNETIVFVAVSSDHRREAFQAADYIMDRLKSEAVFWKREEGAFGRRWIEPTNRDTTDLARWSD